jgi:hypothetical protein
VSVASASVTPHANRRSGAGPFDEAHGEHEKQDEQKVNSVSVSNVLLKKMSDGVQPDDRCRDRAGTLGEHRSSQQVHTPHGERRQRELHAAHGLQVAARGERPDTDATSAGKSGGRMDVGWPSFPRKRPVLENVRCNGGVVLVRRQS